MAIDSSESQLVNEARPNDLSPAPPDAPPRPRKRRPFRALLRIAVLVYLGWCGFLFFMQESVIFPTGMTRRAGEGYIPQNVERLWLDIGDGAKVEAWLVRPSESPPPGGWPLAVIFHGNAEVIDDYLGHA